MARPVRGGSYGSPSGTPGGPPPSRPPQLKCGVEMAELDPGISGGELPVDRPGGGVSVGLPGRNLLPKQGSVRDAAVQALAAQDAEFELGDVEPTAVGGRGVQLQLGGQPLRLIGREGL